MNRRNFLASNVSALILGSSACSEGNLALTPRLKTTSGRVQGEIINGVHRFLGIPYAKPPFGSLRWRSPERREFSTQIFPATHYGNICPQTGQANSSKHSEGEDCLNLNIWCQDPANKNLPVMLWLHGGGQVSGSGANELYDGTHFAREGVILVTCNRRLGAEGFLYLEELFGDNIGPGNLGNQDVICALEWIVENIEGFGGNPNNITLFGESGGAAMCQAVVATPGSKGLFQKVIAQSGGHSVQRVETATKVALTVIDSLGIRPGQLERLSKVPWSQLVDLYPELERRPELNTPQIYLPVLNQHMPVHPVDAPYSGHGLELDYLIGTCRDEMNFFTALGMTIEDSQFHRRANRVIEAADVSWRELIQTYRESRPHLDAKDLAKIAVGDMWFRLPSIRIADGHAQSSSQQTFMYLFEWESPFIGAAHALDLMVFGNGLPLPILSGFSSYEKAAEFMRKAWVNFASSGNPSTEQFIWPSYKENKNTISISETPSVLRDPYTDESILLAKALNEDWKAAGL